MRTVHAVGSHVDLLICVGLDLITARHSFKAEKCVAPAQSFNEIVL